MSAKAEAKAAAALRELGATLRTKCPAETMCVYDFTCVMSSKSSSFFSALCEKVS